MDKNALKQQRKEAYRKAKEMRDANPVYQALKEQARHERKTRYRAFRDQQRLIKQEEKQKRIAEKDAALMAFFVTAEELEKRQRQKSSIIVEQQTTQRVSSS